MADENGVSLENEDQTTEREKKMKQRIEALEGENEGIKDQMMKLTAEIESLRSNESEAEEQKKALDMVARRASQLEMEVSRLQHDLISAMSEGEEANNEIKGLKKVIQEKEIEIAEIKKEKAEIEKKVRELERKIGVLEVKEIEERSKRVRMEEEMREKIDEKEKEVSGYKIKLLELENKSSKQLALAEEKSKAMEGKVESLDKAMTMIKQHKKKMDWPMIAAGSTGAFVAVAAVVYACRGAKRS